jgi:hypothetical protein
MITNADPNFYGITVPQVFAFLLTIAAAYSSARWASAESRKQFGRKTEDDERAAAALEAARSILLPKLLPN